MELPYGLGTKAREKRWEEIKENRETARVANCFGTKDFEIKREGHIVVEIFNEKLGRKQQYIAKEYYDICPMCGNFMLVRYIVGTTYFAFCKKECYKKYEELKKLCETSENEAKE